MTDADLIAQILAGEEDLYARLVERHTGLVWAICSSHISNRADCEEVAQDVFTQCYLRLNTLRQPEAFARWLGQLARNACLNWIRATARRRDAMARYEENARMSEGVGQGAAAEALARDDIHRAILSLVHTLPERTRQAMLLCYSEGYSQTDAAQILGISHEAVKKRIQSGRAKLLEQIGDQFEPALRSKRHEEATTRAILAAVPFGKAAWLGKAGIIAATGAKPALIGGIAIMSKKTALTIATAFVLLLVGGGVWQASHDAHTRVAGHVAETARDVIAVEESAADTAVDSAGAVLMSDTSDTSAKSEAPLEVQAQTSTPSATSDNHNSKPDTAPPEPPASIAGYVMDDAARPIGDADIRVEIMAEGLTALHAYEAKTSPSGVYRVADIHFFGPARVYGAARGHASGTRELSITPGSVHEGIDFTLPASEEFVRGTVVSDKSSPIPGAVVRLRTCGGSEPGKMGSWANEGGSMGFAMSDASGQFEIAVSMPGLCDLSISKDGYGDGFFGAVPTGTENGRFMLHSPGQIAGRVTNPDGEPVPNKTVAAQGFAHIGGVETADTLKQGSSIALTATDGTYVLENISQDGYYGVAVMDAATADRAELATTFWPRGPVVLAMQDRVHVQSGETTRVDFVIHPLSRVWGTVTDRTTGAGVRNLRIRVYERGSDTPATNSPAYTDGGGRYELNDVALKGHCTLALSAWYTWTLGGALASGMEAPIEFELAPGETREMSFSVNAPISIPVRVVDPSGYPVPGLAFGIGEVRAMGKNYSSSSHGPSGTDGSFIFDGLSPVGTYFAFVHDPTTSTWPAMRNAIRAESGPITGQPGETVPEVVLVVEPKGGVEGIVLTQDGATLANTQISLVAEQDNGTRTPAMQVVTDSQGRFTTLYAFPEGLYSRIYIGRAVSPQQIEVVSVENLPIEADTVVDIGELWLRALSPDETAAILP